MKKVVFFVLSLILFEQCFSQTDKYLSYLNINSTAIALNNNTINFDQDFYRNQLFFFGFIHGSETPQKIDFQLIKTLSQNGINNYAPEVEFSLAYFFNQYLKSGDEHFLDYACANYQSRVPQDASIQFKNKWKEIYVYNKTLKSENSIQILGFDQSYSTELVLTHLAFIAPKKATGIEVIDSLRFFRNFEMENTNIISGKPVYKSGKSWDYFFGTAKTRYFKKFRNAYKNDSLNILQAFDEYAADLKHLMNQSKSGNRELVIFDNFQKIGLPKIKNGEKIYSNYGYYHVQQDKINNTSPLAKLIKDSCDIKTISIIGFLKDSECLKERKFKAVGTLEIKEVKFKKAIYNGYKTSKSYDGDSFFEKVNGLDLLEKVSQNNDITIFKIDGKNSPFNETMLFADFKRGGKNWRVEQDAVATDYFQYIVLIKNSFPNIPLEEE